MKPFALVCALVLSALTPQLASAEQLQDFGDYVVHYSAFNADFLSPEIATRYGITRSANRAVLNIAVQRREGPATVPVAAQVSGKTLTEYGQQTPLELHQAKDGDVVYYLAEFSISEGQTLDFRIKVDPKGSKRSLDVKFRQQFFVSQH